MALNAPVSNLQDVDLRLLRVFMSVVRNGGFTAAQTELNIGQSTISGYISRLESRLGLRLCERGRSGFFLTVNGRQVFEAASDLFRELDNFRTKVGEARNELVGAYYVGMVDAIAGIPDCLISKIFEKFSLEANNVFLDLRLASPQALVRGLLNKRFDAAILPVFRVPSGIELISVDRFNRQTLYCGKGHPFFQRPDSEITLEALSDTPFASRLHMEGWSHPAGQKFNARASTVDVECQLLLILSGRFISYLPEYYARSWEEQGMLRPLFRDSLSYFSDVNFAVRTGDDSNTTKLLVECIHSVVPE